MASESLEYAGPAELLFSISQLQDVGLASYPVKNYLHRMPDYRLLCG